MASQLASRIKSRLSLRRRSSHGPVISTDSHDSVSTAPKAAAASTPAASAGCSPATAMPVMVVLEEAPNTSTTASTDSIAHAHGDGAKNRGSWSDAATTSSSHNGLPDADAEAVDAGAPPIGRKVVLLDLTQQSEQQQQQQGDSPVTRSNSNNVSVPAPSLSGTNSTSDAPASDCRLHHKRANSSSSSTNSTAVAHQHQQQQQPPPPRLAPSTNASSFGSKPCHHNHIQPQGQYYPASPPTQPLHCIREHSAAAIDRQPLPPHDPDDLPYRASCASSNHNLNTTLAARIAQASLPTQHSQQSPSTPTAASVHHHQQQQAPPRSPAPTRRKSSQSRSTTLPAAPSTLAVGRDYSNTTMPPTRKVWVKRQDASPTTVTINDDDLVDDVRDTVLRKYANSLGRTFDSPDINIRLCPRDRQRDRILGPDEVMSRLIESYYPGGQTMDEALIIDIPRRTPKASPRYVQAPHAAAANYYEDENRPSENGEGYFPPFQGMPSPHAPLAVPGAPNGGPPHSISVIGTGHIPLIPSPGSSMRPTRHHRGDRPRLGRTHTSASVILSGGGVANNGIPFRPRPPHSRTHSNSSEAPLHGQIPGALNMVNLPKSPAPEHVQPIHVDTPPARTSSPRAPTSRIKKSKKSVEYGGSNTPGPLNSTVPPINVLIVEDNPINLRLLEAFVKRLKVRWQTAMNGRDAVKKWRTGGFHLVLMDIQLPGMNGLDATREIRRLERVNSIGVFSSTPSTPQEELTLELLEQDRLADRSLFKGPVIIVALTASSLQSDRHEALAAGCNDFLTKPVNFGWLERKVMEWGCMQALIDFSGWRRWKDIALEAEEKEAKAKAAAKAAKSKKARSSLAAAAS
ncbi:Putative CheY-like superfamily [[Torrubiella] hemipterigena]|uniref:Putative CheY-like superfamily n=1 Tax=[Torrubiella] hemipterigena TaxID=1531966 RepID=A0A0A1SXQ5_9HYPO|nr:Putative CheY-like superfamily [[Torrubiella] hemipterigena]